MDKNTNSLKFFYNKRQLGKSISPSELMEMLNAMAEELKLYSSSPLLSAAFHRCSNYFCYEANYPYQKNFQYVPKTYIFMKEPNFSMTDMSAYDAYMFIFSLSKHLQGNSVDLEHWPQYFSQKVVPSGASTEKLCKHLSIIDENVPRARSEALMRQTSDPFTDTKAAAGKRESDSLIRAAQKEADSIRAEAEKIRSEAQTRRTEAETLMEEARIKMSEAEAAKASVETARAGAVQAPVAVQPACPEKTPPRQELRIEDSLDELRRALMSTNAQMRKLEDSILEAGLEETIRQLLDLYNLIADSRDSALEMAKKFQKTDPQDTARNLGEFLNMIAGFMTSYGVTVHTSALGDHFLPKTQEVRQGPAQYDPRSAVVMESLRSGFALDDVVLQKERVWIK